MFPSSLFLPSINTILQDSITALGFQIFFYLGLTGFACAWYYRKMLTERFLASITHVIWPFVSASFLFFVAIYSAPSFDLLTNVVGIGGILIGAVPLLINRFLKKEPYARIASA